MATMNRTDGTFDAIEINPSETAVLQTAGTYVDSDITVRAAAAPDTKVTQSNSTANGNYRLLLSNSANNTEETATSKKSANFYANPSTGILTTQYLNVGSSLAGANKFGLSVGGFARVGTTLYTQNIGLPLTTDFDETTKNNQHGSWVYDSTKVQSYLKVGDETSKKKGVVALINDKGAISQFIPPTTESANHQFDLVLPGQSGTLALKSEIPNVGSTMSRSATSSSNLATNTWTEAVSSNDTSSGGTFLVIGTVLFSSATGGRRGVRVKQLGTAASNAATQVIAASTSGSATYYVQAMSVFSVDSMAKFTVDAFTSTACAPSESYIKVIRLN